MGSFFIYLLYNNDNFMNKMTQCFSNIFLKFKKMCTAKTGTILVFLSLLCGLCVSAQATETYYPGRLLVKPKPYVSLASLEKFNKTMGIQSIRILQAGNNDWQIIEFNPLENIEEKAKEYLKSGLVQYVEPDYIVSINKTPDDPSFSVSNHCYSFKTTDTVTAWDTLTDAYRTNTVVNGSTITTNITDIVVAVVDTGVNYSHEDLADNMWTNSNEIPDNGIDDDGNGIIDDYYGVRYDNGEPTGDPMDAHGHGTHVSGTIGGRGNNALGVAGVCWQVKIMACGALGADGSGSTTDIIQAIAYARKQGANIINMSLGGGGATRSFLDELKVCRDANILVVIAAGNDTNNNDANPAYPANYCTSTDNIIVVGSCTSRDRVSSFSNYGRKTVHIFAPGSDIWSTGLHYTPQGELDNSYYELMSGTSMACPFVAGAAALCMAAHPDDTYLQIKNTILNGVDPVSAMSKKCSTGGRINVANIVKSLVTDDGFVYTISGTTASIIGYEGSDMDPVIPSTIKDTYTVTSIGDQAFYGDKITSITVADTVLTIGISTFQNCTSLTSVYLGESVITIGAKTFASCSALTTINIPASVTTLGSEWLLGCTSLTTITVADENENFADENGYLLTKDRLTLLCAPSGKDSEFNIPSSVTTIGESAFAYATKLPATITLPNNVRRVGQNAFCYCTSLEEIIFGSDFTSIGIYAFYGCTNLKSFFFQGNAPATMDETFVNIGDDAIVYYYDDSIDWEIEEGYWHGLQAEAVEKTGVQTKPLIQYNIQDGKLIITYTGTLYSSPNGNTWTKVEDALSPYTVENTQNGMLFYKAVVE